VTERWMKCKTPFFFRKPPPHLLSGMVLHLAAHAHAVAHQGVATRGRQLGGGHRLGQGACFSEGVGKMSTSSQQSRRIK
jgi:hypothetical protein